MKRRARAMKRSAMLLLREPKARFIAEGCFILHAPQVRFISKQKSTALAVLFCLEAPPGIEPGNKSFADFCLTAWLWRHILFWGRSIPPIAVASTYINRKSFDFADCYNFADTIAPYFRVRISGADYGDRTRHLDLGKVALYQMS